MPPKPFEDPTLRRRYEMMMDLGVTQTVDARINDDGTIVEVTETLHRGDEGFEALFWENMSYGYNIEEGKDASQPD